MCSSIPLSSGGVVVEVGLPPPGYVVYQKIENQNGSL